VTGPDRAAFLQGQLTQDVRLAESCRAVPAAGLTPKGKLLFAGRLVGLDDRLRLLLPRAVREKARAHLAKYALFQKVEIEDRSDDFARLAIYGDTGTPPDLPGALSLPGDYEVSWDVLVPAPALDAARAALDGAGASELAAEEAEARRIEAGRPEFGVDADETHLTDEAGLADAVSTTKGCYVGQEIVARLRTYGRVNKRLVGFRFPDGNVPAGTALRRPDEAEPSRVEAGRVTSAAVSGHLGAIGLGYAARDVAAGDRLVATADGPAAGASAIVSELPFA
jgi:folate-binding protein YgfZ